MRPVPWRPSPPTILAGKKSADDVAATLVVQKPFVIAQWTDALKGVGRWLIPPLADFLVDEKRSVSERGLIATVYGNFAADLPDAYARLEKQLEEKNAPDAPVDVKIALAKKQASIGMALLAMGKGEKVWPLLKHSPDPTLRSYLIERLGPGGVDPKVADRPFGGGAGGVGEAGHPVEPGRVWPGSFIAGPAIEPSGPAAATVRGRP